MNVLGGGEGDCEEIGRFGGNTDVIVCALGRRSGWEEPKDLREGSVWRFAIVGKDDKLAGGEGRGMDGGAVIGAPLPADDGFMIDLGEYNVCSLIL